MTKNLDSIVMVRVLPTIIDKQGGYEGYNVNDHKEGDGLSVVFLSSVKLEESNRLL